MWTLACIRKLMPYLSNTTVVGTLHKMHIPWRSSYKGRSHWKYVVA